MNLHEVRKSSKQDIQDFITDRFDQQKVCMQETHRSWMLNLAWIRGYQNLDFSTTSRNWIKPKLDSWRVRLINNLMLPVVRKGVARTTHIRPIWDVIPATSDEEDIQIAQTSTKLMQYYWQLSGMSIELIRLAFWQGSIGNAFLKVGWDFDKGDPLQIESKNVEKGLIQQLTEKLGIAEVPELIDTQSGELSVDTIPAFNITFDDSVAIFDRSQWCIESQLRSKDYIVEKYGTKFRNLSEASESDVFVYPFAQEQKLKKEKGVLVHELFVRKNKKFKRGLHAVIGGGEYLKTPEDNPFNHGELPYAHYLEVYDPASPWGTCVSEQMRPNQALYNRIKSGITEQINQMANLQWLNPRNSGSTFTNRPGGVIQYNWPRKPEQVVLRPIPAYVERMLDRTRLDIQDTTSSHDVSEAKAEPGIRSGKAVLALQDADDSVLGPTLLWFDEQLSRTGVLAIQTISQFVDEEKVVQVRGEFNELETVTFTGEALKGKNSGDYWQVRVKTYGRQALSRSGRESLVRTLLELKLKDPVVDKEELIRILGAGDALSIYDVYSADRTRQWREIEDKIVQGQQVVPALGQNHSTHIDTIKRYQAGTKWDKLDEEQQEAVVKHLDMHIRQQALEAVLPQIYAQQAIQGALPNAGGNGQQTQGGSQGQGTGGG